MDSIFIIDFLQFWDHKKPLSSTSLKQLNFWKLRCIYYLFYYKCAKLPSKDEETQQYDVLTKKSFYIVASVWPIL